MEGKPSKLIPALIGGSIMGVLSSVPIINLGNCLCCMWVILGGGVGAYFYWRELSPDNEFSAGEGALVGLLSGIFGALFGTLIGYFFIATTGSNWFQQIMESIIESGEDIPTEFEDWLDTFEEGGFYSSLFVFIDLFFRIVLNSIFGTLGGIIGAAIFRKRKTADREGADKKA
ncbi:DUF4199 domain-containing protein [bacterium]|nr:DUF4199 domain-containing protein [bacterium]